MPIRVPLTWMGETPLSAMPRLASERMEPDSPILPAAAGSLPSSSPVREGHGEPVTGASQACAAMRKRSMACRSANGLSAASKRRSNRLPAKGSLVWERPEGTGPGCAEPPGPEPVARPSDCRVAPSPAQTSAAAPATAVGRAQTIGAKRLSGLGRCARCGRRSVHWYPTSFAHAGTAMSGGRTGGGWRFWRAGRRPWPTSAMVAEDAAFRNARENSDKGERPRRGRERDPTGLGGHHERRQPGSSGNSAASRTLSGG